MLRGIGERGFSFACLIMNSDQGTDMEVDNEIRLREIGSPHIQIHTHTGCYEKTSAEQECRAVREKKEPADGAVERPNAAVSLSLPLTQRA